MNRLTTCAAVLSVLSGVALCGCRKVQTPDLIASTNSAVWADRTFGTVVCGDGQTRPVRLGFRADGVVLWRIDNDGQ
jgi:hypothetical protein